MTESPKHPMIPFVSEFPARPSKIPKTEDLSDGKEQEEPSSVAKSMSPNPRIQRYLVAIEYIGTRFAGSQKQLNCRTVVGALEEAFRKFIGQPVSICLSSRTDAGVHALSNVCHVDIERISKRKPGEVLPPHEPVVVRRAVNHFLQRHEGDIMVIDVRCVPTDFHARFNARERT
uniref:tRNA pseudouridine synthase n=1 Tax=Rhizophora mucronata TaxID=61149 RepID=A0A2P2KZF1_RHIMU